MSSQIQGKLTYGEIKQQLLDAGFTEEWIQENYPGGRIDMEMLKEMYDVMQQQGAGIPKMNYTNLTGFLDNYTQNNSGQQYNQLKTYLSNQGYDDAAIDNILKSAYGYNPNLLSNITGSLFDGLPGDIPDPRGGIGLQSMQFLTGTFDKFFGPQGSIRNFKANQKAFKASKPERTRYEVDIDPNDPNEYVFDPYDAAEGTLSTKAQYKDRLDEFSQFEYNPTTNQYDAYYSPRALDEDTPGRTMSQIKEGLSDRELQAFEGLNIMPDDSSFDITDGATIYYEPGEDTRSQEEIDAATVNILERSNPKTSSDPSTIYFDPVYQKGGSLPMAQKGLEKYQTQGSLTDYFINTGFGANEGIIDNTNVVIPSFSIDDGSYQGEQSVSTNTPSAFSYGTPFSGISTSLSDPVEEARIRAQENYENQQARIEGFKNVSDYQAAVDREDAFQSDNTNVVLPQFNLDGDYLGMGTSSSDYMLRRFRDFSGKRNDGFGGFEFLPYTGEAIDAGLTIDALRQGNFGDAALYGAGFLLPFVPGTSLRRFFRGKPTPTRQPYIPTAAELASQERVLKRLDKSVNNPNNIDNPSIIAANRSAIRNDYDVPRAIDINAKANLDNAYNDAYSRAFERQNSREAFQTLLDQGLTPDQARTFISNRNNLLTSQQRDLFITRRPGIEGVMYGNTNTAGLHQSLVDDRFRFGYITPKGKTVTRTPTFFGDDIARRRQQSMRDATAAHEVSHRGDVAGKLMTPRDFDMIDDALYPNPKGFNTYLAEPTEVRARINALRDFTQQNPNVRVKDFNIPNNPLLFPGYMRRSFLNPGPYRQYNQLKRIMSPDQIDLLYKGLSQVEPQQGMDVLPMAQFGLIDDFDLTGEAEEIDLTGGSMFDNEGIFETEVQQPGTFNPYTLDYNPYADPVITEGKKQFGDRLLNFVQSPTAGLMGDIGSTAVGFARFMNPFLNDIQAKRQEEELERYGMADNITPLDFSEFPTKGIQSTRSNLLGPESARYTYLNYGRRGTEINDSREVEVDEETLLQLKKLGAEIEIL
tara:strand:+ start:14161 stop:17268 length:3108 start_codon:yes stop_codon:yes gene_type:complete